VGSGRASFVRQQRSSCIYAVRRRRGAGFDPCCWEVDDRAGGFIQNQIRHRLFESTKTVVTPTVFKAYRVPVTGVNPITSRACCRTRQPLSGYSYTGSLLRLFYATRSAKLNLGFSDAEGEPRPLDQKINSNPGEYNREGIAVHPTLLHRVLAHRGHTFLSWGQGGSQKYCPRDRSICQKNYKNAGLDRTGDYQMKSSKGAPDSQGSCSSLCKERDDFIAAQGSACGCTTAGLGPITGKPNECNCWDDNTRFPLTTREINQKTSINKL